MIKGPINTYSLKWSIGLHGALFCLALLFSSMPACRRKELIMPLDFTVVLEEASESEAQEEVSEPQTQTMPEPEPPAPLPEPAREPVVLKQEKPKPKPEPKPRPKPKPKPKPEPKPKPKPPEKQPFKKGKRIEAPKPANDFTKLKRVTTQPTDKPLSRAEIEKALQAGARPGTQNVLPESETARCIMLVRRAMYSAWQHPSNADSGHRPALLEISLDMGGRIVSRRLTQSSGNPVYDQTVMQAANSVTSISGLTRGFLQQYQTLVIEFKLE